MNTLDNEVFSLGQKSSIGGRLLKPYAFNWPSSCVQNEDE